MFVLNQLVALIEVSIPFILRHIIRYIENDSATQAEEYWTIFFVLVMIFSIFLSRILSENILFYGCKVGTQAKQGIGGLIYCKVTKLSPSATKLYNKGDMVSLTQVDTDKVTFLFDTFPDVVVIPLKILFLIIALYMFIGIALLAAVGVIIIFSIINYVIAVLSNIVQRQRMKRTSSRIHRVTEIVDNIKLIKFNSWVEKYIQIAKQARSEELVMKVRKELLEGINEMFMNLNYPLLTVSVFLVAIMWKDMSIAVPTALAILQLLNSLKESSRSVPYFIGEFTEFMVSMERIQAFLQSDELEVNGIVYDKFNNTSISIKNGNFYWGFQRSSNSNDESKDKSDNDIKRSKYIDFAKLTKLLIVSM